MPRNTKNKLRAVGSIPVLCLAAWYASCGGEAIPGRPDDTSEDESTPTASVNEKDSEGLSSIPDTESLSETDSNASAEDTQESTRTDSLDSDSEPLPVVTTLLRTVQPVVEATAQKAATRAQWGLTEDGPGEPYLLREDLGVDAYLPTSEPSSLVFFWHVTDSQIIDEESPARAIGSDDPLQAAFRLQESWSAQMLDAAIRTARRVHEVAPLDFALMTGDLIDNIHGNELDWLMTILDGGQVNPDSGKDNDPLSGKDNDPHDPFDALGLGNIPWYFTLGNHDDLILGNFATLDWLVADPTGKTVSTLSNAVIPTCLDHPYFAEESPTPARCYVPNRGYYKGKTVVPDLARAFIDRRDWVDALWGSTTLPAGHGLASHDPFFDYAMDIPETDGPLRLIVLDTVAPEMANGTLSDGQLNWLEQELRAAEAARQLVIVASHHPSWWITGKGQQLVALLRSSPNVIVHISGHVHKNGIVPHIAPSGASIDHGYYEIVTSSTLVWPQQTRLVEVVDNRDGTVSIFCTMLDYEIPPDMPLLEGGRFYALYDVQAGSGEQGQGEPADRNVELRIPIPQDVADVLAELPQRTVESYRFPRETQI